MAAPNPEELGFSPSFDQPAPYMRATLKLALQVLETAPGPRTTVQSPQRWAADASWKLDYANVERIAPVELDRRRQEFARQKQIAKQVLHREKDAAA